MGIVGNSHIGPVRAETVHSGRIASIYHWGLLGDYCSNYPAIIDITSDNC